MRKFLITSEAVAEGHPDKIADQIADAILDEVIRQLKLLRPIYRKTANYGHFGREEPEFTWEKKTR